MKINNSLAQVVKDGLVGVIVVLFSFIILVGWWLGREGINDIRELWEVLEDLFFFQKFGDGFFIGPMPFVFLTEFITIGISGRWLEITGPRELWVRNSLLVASISGLTEFFVFSIFYIPLSGNWAGIEAFLFEAAIIGAAMAVGIIIGFVIGTLAGTIFNPDKRIYRILIGAISGTTVAYSVGFGIVFLQIIVQNID